MPIPYNKRKGYYQERYKKQKEQPGVKRVNSSHPKPKKDFTPPKLTPKNGDKINQQLVATITSALNQISQANTLFQQEIREHLLNQTSNNAEVLKIVNQLGEKVNKLPPKPPMAKPPGQTKFGISWKLSTDSKKLLAERIKELESQTGIKKGEAGWEKQVRQKAQNSLPEIQAKQKIRNKERWKEIKNLLAWVGK